MVQGGKWQTKWMDQCSAGGSNLITTTYGSFVNTKKTLLVHACIFSVCGLLVGFLAYQNYFFNTQAAYLVEVQDEYREYIDIMKNFLDSSTSDDRVCVHGADCDGFECNDLSESFVVLN